MIQNHPQKITKRIVKMYHKRLIEQKIYFKTKNNSTYKKSLLTNAFPELESLYEMFYFENKNDVDGIVMKTFSKIIKTKNKHAVKSKP